MKKDSLAVACIHQYYKPYYNDKDAIQVPVVLSRLLDLKCKYYTRYMIGLPQNAKNCELFVVGPTHSKANLKRIESNLETELTFSTVWYAFCAFRAGLRSNILIIYHLNARTSIAIAVYKLTNYLKFRKSFVYIKMDLGVLEAQKLLKRGETGSALIGRIKHLIMICGARYIADAISAESSETIRLFNQSRCGLEAKMRLVCNCPSDSFFDNHLINETNVVRKKQIIVVGRMGVHQKATDIVLHAFAEFHRKFCDWKLLLVGPSNAEFFKMLHSQDKLISSGAISYAGVTSDKADLMRHYKESAIFLFPSRYEGASIALVEACFFGCVPVCTPVGNAKDVLGEYYNKLTVPIDNSTAVAAKLCELAEGQKELRECSVYLASHAAKFRWNIQLQSLAEEIQESHN